MSNGFGRGAEELGIQPLDLGQAGSTVQDLPTPAQ
jgi:hypothetical protein